MADNVAITAGSGTTVGTSEVTIAATAVQVQRVTIGAAPTGSYGAKAPTTTASATSIAANNERKSLLLRNNGTVRVYFGSDSSITSANAPYIDPGESYEETVYLGIIYLLAASSTGDIRYWERS